MWSNAPEWLMTSVKRYLPILAAALAGWLSYWIFGGEKPAPIPLPIPTLEANEPESDPIYYCGRLESIRDNFTAKPWPLRRIQWSVDTAAFTGGLTQQQILEAFRAAWAAWAAGIDIEPTWTDKPESAHVRIKFGDYDGSGKVLAWSELADGTTTTKHQLYDRAEKWGTFSGSTAGIDLVRVAAHEIGHVLGLVHDDGSGNALMDPIYSKSIRFPTEQDISRALALGYKATPKPPDPGMPPSPITITFPISADAAAVADALRKAGFKVEPPPK